MDALYMEFGRLLRAARKDAKLTQSDVAGRVGLTRTSITNIERGSQHIGLHQLFLLSSAVGVRPEELLPDREAALEDLIPARALKALRVDKDEDGLIFASRVLGKLPAERQKPPKAVAG